MGAFSSLPYLLICGAASLPLAGVFPAFADDSDPRPFARMPYLQTATSNSICVAWRNDGPISPVVRFGTARELFASLIRP